jgi:hypothetical protein
MAGDAPTDLIHIGTVNKELTGARNLYEIPTSDLRQKAFAHDILSIRILSECG